jgi:hypothetical protein
VSSPVEPPPVLKALLGASRISQVTNNREEAAMKKKHQTKYIRVRGVQRDTIDVRKLGRAVIALAAAKADAEAEAEHIKKKQDDAPKAAS